MRPPLAPFRRSALSRDRRLTSLAGSAKSGECGTSHRKIRFRNVADCTRTLGARNLLLRQGQVCLDGLDLRGSTFKVSPSPMPRRACVWHNWLPPDSRPYSLLLDCTLSLIDDRRIAPVEPHQHIAFIHEAADIENHLYDLARDLWRDVRLRIAGEVAGRLEVRRD